MIDDDAGDDEDMMSLRIISLRFEAPMPKAAKSSTLGSIFRWLSLTIRSDPFNLVM